MCRLAGEDTEGELGKDAWGGMQEAEEVRAGGVRAEWDAVRAAAGQDRVWGLKDKEGEAERNGHISSATRGD